MTTLHDSRSNETGGDATTSCSLKPRNLSRPQPISVNGVAIPRDAIARETQNHPAAKPIDAWLASARALVVRELLLQEARRLEIAPQPASDDEGRRETDEEAVVRQLVEREVLTPEPDEATCRRIYDQQIERFRSSDLFAVRHILFAAAPGDVAARREAHDAARAVIDELVVAPDRFAALATTLSACPSSAQGGQLGQISRGQTVREFEAALASAPVGEVCPTPVETRYGYHVVLVEQRLEGRPLPFDGVHERIATWLVDRARHAAIRQYIGMLAGRAAITGITLDQQASSLVQ